MRRALLLLGTLFFAGCASVNDSLVRMWFQDTELGDRVNSQIRRGLDKRMSTPEKALPKKSAPAFLDQG